MVPPESVLGVVPTWIGVYLLSAVVFAASAFLFYRRVFRLVLMGKPGRSDRPLVRILGAVKPAFGQSKVLQSVSLKDRAGLGPHVHLLGLPLVPAELSAVHLRRLGVAQAVVHSANEHGRQGICDIPGAPCRRFPGGAVVGSGKTLGVQAAPALIRPDTEGRICHHPCCSSGC